MAADLARVYTLFPKLHDLRARQAGTLSGGEQQMLALGRALMSEARLLMIDELSLGLAPLVVRDIAEHLRALNAGGLTVLLVEQNVHLAFSLAARIYVLENGRVHAEGTAEELRRQPEIERVYLGSPVEAGVRWRQAAAPLSEFGQYLVTGIATGASFALVALGFVAIYRVTHVVNFAQGAFAMLGGYVMSSMLDRALPGPLAALCAVLIVAAIGTLVGVLAVGKPRLPIIASLMITLGLSVLIEGICLLHLGRHPDDLQRRRQQGARRVRLSLSCRSNSSSSRRWRSSSRSSNSSSPAPTSARR